MRFVPAVLVLVLALWGAPAGAQAALPVDTVAASPREVPHATLESLRADRAFDYERATPRGESFWGALRRWLFENLLLPTAEHVPARLFTVMLYLLVAAGLIYGIMRLFGGTRQGGLARPVRSSGLDDALAAGIEHVDLHAWLARARADGASRDVVRLNYLIALQALSASGRIAWSAEKTNRSYLDELRGSAVEQAFESFTRLFDRAWYGLAPVEKQDVEQAEELSARLAQGHGGPR